MSRVGATQGKPTPAFRSQKASSNTGQPEVREKDPRQKPAYWKQGVEVVLLSLDVFDSWMYSDKNKLVEVFQTLKSNQGSIEGLLDDPAQRNELSAHPLPHGLHQWMDGLCAAIENGDLSLSKFDINDLSIAALGLTACISRGQPNLFTGKPAAIAKLQAVSEAFFQRFLAIQDDVQLANPGCVLNLHNLIARLNKAKLFDTTDTMRQTSQCCFGLMKHWIHSPDSALSGLDDLGTDVESGAERGKLKSEIAKRAGKAIVQVESFCDPTDKLLSLNGDEDAVRINRQTLVEVLAWLGGPEAIEFYCQSGEDGMIALSSLAHLSSKLLDWGYLPLDANTRSSLLPLLEAIATVAPQCRDIRWMRSLSNFSDLLGGITKVGRRTLWQDGSHPTLERACAGVLTALAEIPATRLDIRSCVPLFALLRTLEDWLARLDRASPGAASTPASASSSASTSIATSTTTSTAATTTTTTTTTTSATNTASAGVSGTAGSRPGMAQIRDNLGPAVVRLLSSLGPQAIQATQVPDHIVALLDILCWLCRSPALAGTVKPMLEALVGQIKRCTKTWSGSNRSSLAGNLVSLIDHRLVSESQDLYNAVLGQPKSGRKHGRADLLQAAIGGQRLDIKTPLAFPMAPENPAEKPAQAPAQKPGAEPAAKPAVPKAPSYRARATAAPTATAQKKPVAKPQGKFQKVAAGAKPAVVAPERPLATVEVDREEAARIAQENQARESKRRQAAEPAKGKKSGKAANRKRNTKLTAEQAKAARDAQLKNFDEELQAATNLANRSSGRAAAQSLPSSPTPATPQARQAPQASTAAVALNEQGTGFRPMDLLWTDISKTMEGWKITADRDQDPEAQFSMANCYYYGHGVEKDLQRAVHYISLSANGGNSPAAYLQHDFELAAAGTVSWPTLKEKLACLDLSDDLITTLQAMEAGLLSEAEMKIAQQTLTTLADAGNASAQYQLGRLLRDQILVSEEPGRAVKYIRKAADQGLAAAQFYWGSILGGTSGEGNFAESEKYLSMAAAAGHADACAHLARQYWLDASARPGNNRALQAKAVQLWRQGAAQGDSQSQYALGLRYLRGEGIARDESKAIQWIEAAAKDNHIGAKKLLSGLQAMAEEESEPTATNALAPRQPDVRHSRKN